MKALQEVVVRFASYRSGLENVALGINAAIIRLGADAPTDDLIGLDPADPAHFAGEVVPAPVVPQPIVDLTDAVLAESDAAVPADLSEPLAVESAEMAPAENNAAVLVADSPQEAPMAEAVAEEQAVAPKLRNGLFGR